MSVFVVDCLDRPELLPFRNLKHYTQCGADDFVVESALVIERLLASPFDVRSLLLTPQRHETLKSLIPPGVPVYLASRRLISEIAGYDVHRGCLARAAAPEAQRSLQDVLNAKPVQTVLLLEGLADPTNIGTIIRNALAFGVDLVVTDPKGASPFSRRAARTSAGHIFSLPVIEHSPIEAVKVLRDLSPSLKVIAATPTEQADSLADFNRSGPVALMLGNEGHGLSEEALSLADHWIRIPIAKGVDSLNVSASAAVLLYALNQCVSC